MNYGRVVKRVESEMSQEELPLNYLILRSQWTISMKMSTNKVIELSKYVNNSNFATSNMTDQVFRDKRNLRFQNFAFAIVLKGELEFGKIVQ